MNIARTKFYQSLYFRLPALMVVFMLLIGGLQLLFSIKKTEELVVEIQQKIGWGIAAELANLVQPSLVDGLDPPKIEKVFFRLWQANPVLEFYLLDKDGYVLAHFRPHDASQLQKIDIEPIRAALAIERPSLPLYGDYPAKGSFQKIPFSVARIFIGDEPGYLYIPLLSDVYSFVKSGSGDLFIVRTLGVGVTLITVVAVGLGLLFFIYLSRNFSVLTSVVRQYEQGNMDARVEKPGVDEIGELGRSINAMAQTIKEQTDSLKEADTLRRRLVASVSHDLRNPLTAMKGFVEELQTQGAQLDIAEQQRYLEVVQRSIAQQDQLVNDLFELSKLEARERDPQLEPFPIIDLLYDNITRFQPSAEKKGISLSHALDEQLPEVVGDVHLIDRVIANFLNNAIRYTDSGGTVALSAEVEDKHVRIVVSDTGIGIPEEALAHVFEPMFQVDYAESHQRGGSGLGLAIVKRILNMHNSPVQVQSSVGKGSTFCFSLTIAE